MTGLLYWRCVRRLRMAEDLWCGAVRRREGAAEIMNGGLELTSAGKEDDERWRQRGEWPEKKKEKLSNYFSFLVIGKLIPFLQGGKDFPPKFPFPQQSFSFPCYFQTLESWEREQVSLPMPQNPPTKHGLMSLDLPIYMKNTNGGRS